MDFPPSKPVRRWSRALQGQIPSQDLIRVRTLFLERRYKQCITVCEGFTNSTLHPVHQAFLLFHQAISHKALGLAAHVYSRNKIPFLDAAKEKFHEALDVLPQPFAADEAGYQHDLPYSLFELDISSTKVHEPQTDFRDNSATPTIHLSNRTRTPSDASSQYSTSTASSISDTYTVPDFDSYSPRTDVFPPIKSIPHTTTFPEVQKKAEGWSKAEQLCPEESTCTPQQVNTKARLSACLSSTHVLADDLIPSPLFSRTRKIAQIPFPMIYTSGNTESDDPQATSQSLRLLPHTPYTHQMHLSLPTTRQTAVQTLISKFENKVPSPTTPSSYTTASPTPSSTLITPDNQRIFDKTPTTSRFAAIASIFAPSARSQLYEHSHIDSYLTSHALSRYNKSLSDFRTCLHTSLTRTDEAIDQAHEVQERRLKEKQEQAMKAAKPHGTLGQVRLKSYWLLDSAGTPKTPLASADRSLNVDESSSERVQSFTHTKQTSSSTNPATQPYSRAPSSTDIKSSKERSQLTINPTSLRLRGINHETQAKQSHPNTQRLPFKFTPLISPIPETPSQTSPSDQISQLTPSSHPQHQHNTTTLRPTTTQSLPNPTTPTPLKPRFRDLIPSLRPREPTDRKLARMEKLRERGFDVCKEDHGWKGKRYYDGIVRAVERELEVH